MSTDVYIAIDTCLGGIAALMTLGWHTQNILYEKRLKSLNKEYLRKLGITLRHASSHLQNTMQEQQKMDSINDRFEQLWSELRRQRTKVN